MSAKWSVLIVEDDAALGQRMVEALGSGIRSRIAYNGQEAILFAGKRPPGLVIIDVVLPTVDGMEVSRFFKHKFGRETLPILIVTEKADAETRRECAELGCDDFLVSPYELADLTNAANALLSLSRTETELRELGLKREAAKKPLPPEEDNHDELVETICSLRAELAARLITRGFAELAHGHVERIAALAPSYAALDKLRAQLD
jgi:DNA-binding response OmpR family regulator